MSVCHFQDHWLNKFPWLSRVPNQTSKAHCKLCVNTFSLSNMGLRAVNSHRNGKKHAEKEKSACLSTSVSSYLSSTKSNNGPVIPEPVPEIKLDPIVSVEQISKKVPNKLDTFVIKDNVTCAEIKWCIQTVLTHKSIRNAEKDVKVFSGMFPDSEIAKNLQLGRTKMAYIIVHGLSPLFEEILRDRVTVLDHVVIGFDECLNKITQNQQMDLNVRFWDPKENLVKTCYLTSVFLGRSCASDLLEAFLTAVKHFNLKRLLQISMDGPNTNLSFFKQLQKYISETPDDPEILSIGSCGLHTLNVAFKTGVKASGWCILDFLRALYYLFKDSPARRAWYISLTKSTSFPKKFCSVRWLENSSVASRALEILPYLKIFIEGVEKEKVAPNTKTYSLVKDHIKDELLAAKISFFRVISEEFEGFLREYQSDAPLIPFLFTDLTNLTRGLMERIIVKDVLKKTANVLEIDIKDPKIQLAAKNIDVGISTVSALRKAKVAEKDVIQFKKACREFLLQCILKLQERSPLKYSLTEAVSCFDPFVAMNEKVFSKKLEKLLLILIQKKWIVSIEAERAKKQLKDICCRKNVMEKCKSYTRYGIGKKRIDEFWLDILQSAGCPEEAQKLLRMILILSHGNANVERGFSVNSDCLWENMKEESIVARRRVFDYVTMEGGLDELKISRKMVQYVRNARVKYREAQEAERKKSKEQETLLKKKRDAAVQLKELEAKKAKILNDAEKERLIIEEEISALRAIQKI